MKLSKLIIVALVILLYGCSNDDDAVTLTPLSGNVFFEEGEVVVDRNSSTPFEVTINFSGPKRDQDISVGYRITLPAFNPAVAGEDFQPQQNSEFVISRSNASVTVPLVESILDNPEVTEERFFTIELDEISGLTLGNPNTGENSSLTVIIRPDVPPTDPNDPDDFVGDKKFSVSQDDDTFVIPYFSNVDDITLTENPNITRAIIAVHGTSGTASRQLRNMMEAATIEGFPLENLLIVAPQFLEEDDVGPFRLSAEHLLWDGNEWHDGALSVGSEEIASFSVMDSLITRLLDYPNLQDIVLTGHSGGGQFTNRYSMSSPIADDVEARGVNIRFIPNNPASYTYLDNRRLVPGTENTFEVPENLRGCGEFNDYRYGLEGLFGYLDDIGAETIRERLHLRRVIYLVGGNDNNPSFPNFDRRCQALLLGRHRLERGINYFNYLQFYYNDVFNIDITETQNMEIVPRVGHSSSGMYTSEIGRRYLFRD